MCQGQLSPLLVELSVSWKGAIALARDLVAALCESPCRLYQQERLGRKTGEREMEERKGGTDGTECCHFQTWFKILCWGYCRCGNYVIKVFFKIIFKRADTVIL